MARLLVEKVRDTCPFFYAAAMQYAGQRAKIHAAGEGEQVSINVACIGADCMMFTVTGKNDGKPVGGCSVAVLPSILVQLNKKIDGITSSVVEAAADDEKTNPLPSWIHGLGRKLKGLFAEPEEQTKPAAAKPTLVKE